MRKEQPTSMRTKSWATAGIVISWSTFWMFLFSPFGLLAWIGIFIYLVAKKATLKWYFIFSAWLLVPSCDFVTGTVKYFRGTACLQGVGGPQTYHGIDRETRVASRSSGCILVGFELLYFLQTTPAVRVWTNLFGFQRGSYIGAFPTEAEAQEIIASADTITIKRSGHFWQFNIAGQL